MPNRQYHDLFSVVVIQGDVGPAPKFNHPLPELRRHFLDWATNFRMLTERFHALPDRLDGTLGSVATLGSQKGMETGHIEQRGLRPYQSRHFGGAASLPASSFASQASACSAVACRPVVW